MICRFLVRYVTNWRYLKYIAVTKPYLYENIRDIIKLMENIGRKVVIEKQ